MGRLRGKRNRDQDRYWHERRKATQGGMVGAADAGVCCFCSRLLTSSDATVTGAGGDLMCEACCVARGIRVDQIRVKQPSDIETLQSIGALGNFEHIRGGGPGSKASASVVGFDIGSGYGIIRRDRDNPSRDKDIRARLFVRALLWLDRDVTVGPTQSEAEADAIMAMPLATAKDAVKEARHAVYRQQHPLTRDEVPRKFTNEQVREMREKYAAGGTSFKKLAAEYNCSSATVSFIVSGSFYKSAGGPIHSPEWRPSFAWMRYDFAD